MGLLTRLRSWLFGTSGEEEPAAEPDSSDSRLDPNNVTEARGDGADDAVERLQSLTARRERDEQRDE